MCKSAVQKFYCFLILISVLTCRQSANAQAITDQKGDVIRVGVFKASPMVLISPKGPDGLFIEFLQYVAHQEGWKLEFVEATWPEQLDNLKNGKIDLLPAVGYTKERVEIYDFNNYPVYIDSGVLYVGPQFVPHTVFELEGKRIAGLKGSIFTSGFQNYISSFGIDCDIVFTKDNHEVMQLLENGDVDAGICIYSLGNELMKKYSVSLTPISFTPIALHYAVASGSHTEQIQKIDNYIGNMKNVKNSPYTKIYNKWTKKDEKYEFPVWGYWIIASLLLIGFILFAWNFFLNRQVAISTMHLQNEIEERKKAESSALSSLEEKKVLIRELFHRTQNTLQIITGLLTLQGFEFPENSQLHTVIKNTVDRIKTISLVHQMLYKKNDVSHILLSEYIEELVHLLQSSYDSRNNISIEYDVDALVCPFDSAVPIGIIVNELMTNSFKYAFPHGRKGRICISFSKKGEHESKLLYSDNGVGIQESSILDNQNSLGLQLIRNLVEFQLNGSMKIDYSKGLTFSIVIKTNLYRKRV